MAKIKNRILKTVNDFENLQNDPAIVNSAIAKDSEQLDFANGIFERQLHNRHDWSIYNLTAQDDPFFLASLLVKRNKLDDERYFCVDVFERTLKEKYVLQDVINDQDTLNFVIVESEETYKDIVQFALRCIPFFPHPSRTSLVRILDQNPQKYILVIMLDLNEYFFE